MRVSIPTKDADMLLLSNRDLTVKVMSNSKRITYIITNINNHDLIEVDFLNHVEKNVLSFFKEFSKFFGNDLIEYKVKNQYPYIKSFEVVYTEEIGNENVTTRVNQIKDKFVTDPLEPLTTQISNKLYEVYLNLSTKFFSK